MNLRKDFIYIILAYFTAVILIVIVNNNRFTIFLVLLLLTYHIYSFLEVRDKITKDKIFFERSLISKLNKTKRESEETYRRFTSLSTTLGSGIIIVNDDGIISFSNKDVNDYFGKDYNNKDYNSLVGISQLYKFVNQAYLLEKSMRDQIEYNNHFYDLIATPLIEKKLFRGCIIVVHDITLIKTAENFQKQFTADVSHELKTPLSAIKGFSEILDRDKNISEQDRNEFTNLILKESTRMETILSDLLIISKMDRLDYELEFSSIDIKEVLIESSNTLSREIRKKKLNFNIDAKSCICLLDKNKIGQVMINVLKNAINYTDEGRITIKGYIDLNNYVIEVTDTGIGIKESNYDKVFKRFYRVDSTRSRETGGSGLGLSISKNILKKHSGDISVNSVINKGTTFKINIPIKK